MFDCDVDKTSGRPLGIYPATQIRRCLKRRDGKRPLVIMIWPSTKTIKNADDANNFLPPVMVTSLAGLSHYLESVSFLCLVALFVMTVNW